MVGWGPGRTGDRPASEYVQGTCAPLRYATPFSMGPLPNLGTFYQAGRSRPPLVWDGVLWIYNISCISTTYVRVIEPHVRSYLVVQRQRRWERLEEEGK